MEKKSDKTLNKGKPEIRLCAQTLVFLEKQACHQPEQAKALKSRGLSVRETMKK